MRELSIDEVSLISGGFEGAAGEITYNEAMALSAYYAGLGGVLTATGFGAGFGAASFALSAGFGFYAIMIA